MKLQCSALAVAYENASFFPSIIKAFWTPSAAEHRELLRSAVVDADLIPFGHFIDLTTAHPPPKIFLAAEILSDVHLYLEWIQLLAVSDASCMRAGCHFG